MNSQQDFQEHDWALPDPHYQPEFYADVPLKRLISWLIDMVITVVISLLIIPFTAFTGLFFLPLLVLVVGFAYRVATLAKWSATLGMRFTAIELRSRDGTKANGTVGFLHTLTYSFLCAFPILQIVSMIMMVTTRFGQGLGDMALGTVVINRRAAS